MSDLTVVKEPHTGKVFIFRYPTFMTFTRKEWKIIVESVCMDLASEARRK